MWWTSSTEVQKPYVSKDHLIITCQPLGWNKMALQRQWLLFLRNIRPTTGWMDDMFWSIFGGSRDPNFSIRYHRIMQFNQDISNGQKWKDCLITYNIYITYKKQTSKPPPERVQKCLDRPSHIWIPARCLVLRFRCRGCCRGGGSIFTSIWSLGLWHFLRLSMEILNTEISKKHQVGENQLKYHNCWSLSPYDVSMPCMMWSLSALKLFLWGVTVYHFSYKQPQCSIHPSLGLPSEAGFSAPKDILQMALNVKKTSLTKTSFVNASGMVINPIANRKG